MSAAGQQLAATNPPKSNNPLEMDKTGRFTQSEAVKSIATFEQPS
jgi:hypothetical protein